MSQYQDQWEAMIYNNGCDGQCPNVRSMIAKVPLSEWMGLVSQCTHQLTNMENGRVPIHAL